MYGFDCNETCGNCSLAETCDPIDGGCRSGCIIGLQPPLCKAGTNRSPVYYTRVIKFRQFN